MNLRDKFKNKGMATALSSSKADSTEAIPDEPAPQLTEAAKAAPTLRPVVQAEPEPRPDTNTEGQNAPSATPSQPAQNAGVNHPKLKLGNVLARAKAINEQSKATAKEALKVQDKPNISAALAKVMEPEIPTAMQRMKKLKEANEVISSVFPDKPPEEIQFEGFDAEAHLNDLKALELSLIDDVPMLPVLMGRVMRNLQQYEDLAHILNEGQIQVIVEAFAKRKGIEVVMPSKGTGKTAGRSVASLTKDMNVEQILGML